MLVPGPLLGVAPFVVRSEAPSIVPIAKAAYQRSKRIWKLYWQRADLEWHAYQPVPEVSALEQFVAVVDADEYGCFFG